MTIRAMTSPIPVANGATCQAVHHLATSSPAYLNAQSH